MSITLDHTIVRAHDPQQTTRFLAQLLGLDPPRQLGPFTVLQVGPTSLDFVQTDDEIRPRHFAFLVEAITRPYGSRGCEAEHPHPLLACGD
ncbi:MAG TPA: hypothetical protein VJT80_23165 [Steroidobacteraceae bacterium]|nr:hypothetical protein [Steroidobacteraceae bacterium]